MERCLRKSKSITRRWVVNTLGVILILLIGVEIGLGIGFKNYYYDISRNTLSSKADILYARLNLIRGSDTTSVYQEIKTMVENFANKDTCELMAINHYGRIAMTSSGFMYDADKKIRMPDYQEALTSSDGRGYFVGQDGSGQRIMAYTVMLPVVNSDFVALRLVSSMENVDRLIFSNIALVTVICMAIIIFVVISGVYFVKSIVIPVRDVGQAARKIASGDLDTRIYKKSDDELGELCDIINYMADELSNSENMKNEFISSVSHELRTPLTAIKGWGETLLATGSQDTETMQKGMKVIIDETERLSQMVEELLDFSKIESGRLTLVKTKMDLLAELEDAVLIYGERAKRENIAFTYDGPEMLPFIFGDKNRLRQVFINIIDNAIKYSDSGDSVTVSAAEKNGYIEVTVADTGCGISAVDLPKIKTKFYKANSTRRGSGIGLALANEIVTMHGGEIQIDSKENVGTTVTVLLPINLKKGEDKPTEITVNDGKEQGVEQAAKKSEQPQEQDRRTGADRGNYDAGHRQDFDEHPDDGRQY